MSWSEGDRFIVDDDVIDLNEGARSWSGHLKQRLTLRGGECGSIVNIVSTIEGSLNVHFDDAIYSQEQLLWCSVSSKVAIYFKPISGPCGGCLQIGIVSDTVDYLCPSCRAKAYP